MINKEIKKLVEGNALALATVNEDGRPHCIAVAFVKVISPLRLLITDNYMVDTRRNIIRNAEAEICAWNKDWQKNCLGYRLKGKMKYFQSGKWLLLAKKIPENKNEPCKGAIIMTIYQIKKLA